MRSLFFFRGFLGFAALLNITVETIKAIIPFLVLLIVVTLGFSLGTHLLLQHTIFGGDPNYSDPFQTILTVWCAPLSGSRAAVRHSPHSAHGLC